MLPFLQPKKMVSVIVARRGKDGSTEVKPEVKAGKDSVNPDLKEAMELLLRATDERSIDGMAKAFQAAFEICESYPHEEYEAEEEME